MKSDGDEASTGSLFTLRKEAKYHTYHVTIGKELEGDATSYQELLDMFRNANSGDDINLYLGCEGGNTDVSCVLASAIRDSVATVNAIIIARSYSAACDIALSADSLTLNPYTFLMFHNYCMGIEGKGNELLTRIKHEHKVEEQMIVDIYTPFLTKAEIKDILNDRDIYVHWNDKDLDERIARHFNSEEGDE